MSRKRREYTYEEYKKAMELLKKGYGLTKTCRILEWPETKISTLYYWKHGRIPPLARWKVEPCIELAHTIGVLYNGDGCVSKNESRYRYVIRLATIDPEFAEVFSRAMARLLNRNYHKPYWSKREKVWVAEYKSKAFYKWYKKTEEQGLEGFKPYIEYKRKQ